MIRRTLVLCLVMAASISASYAQSTVESLLKRYNNNEDVLAFTLTGNLLDIFDDLADSTAVESKINAVSVLIFSKGDDISSGDATKVRELLDKTGFESLINARSQGNLFKIYAQDEGDYIASLYAHIITPDRQIYATLKGNIRYEDITKINPESLLGLSTSFD